MSHKLNPSYYYPAQNKKSHLLLVLLHCMGGHVLQLKRHIAFLNSLGFSIYTYPAFAHSTTILLPQSGDCPLPESLISTLRAGKNNIFEIWAEELNQHLDHLPVADPKVIFSFSLPSVSAFLSLSRRPDIKALICDGGPFLNVHRCVYRLFAHYYQVPSPWLKMYFSVQMAWIFRDLFLGSLIQKIQVPSNFPILSLRGGRDQQVHPVDINLFFQKIKTKPQVCVLKKSDHLKGLKAEPELYTQTVQQFLNRLQKRLA